MLKDYVWNERSLTSLLYVEQRCLPDTRAAGGGGEYGDERNTWLNVSPGGRELQGDGRAPVSESVSPSLF